MMTAYDSVTNSSNIYTIDGISIGCAEAGIRKTGRLDLTVIRISPGAAVAGVFTTSQFCAAPVLLCQQALKEKKGIESIVINTGVANAGTGEQGMLAAQQVCRALSKHLMIDEHKILPCSTGVIMEALPAEKIINSLPQALADLSANNWLKAATAIMTTDTHPKLASKKIMINDNPVHVTGISKGAGMIQPNMATMLGFIATDACITQSVIEILINDIVDVSFNSITVDGDMSTNDSFIVIATGKANNTVIDSTEHPDYLAVKTSITEVAITLAQAIIRDGEGATKFITIQVQEAKDASEARKVAYAIANSPLVKTAFFASDPNLGRILAAIGHADVIDMDNKKIKVWLDSLLVAENGGRAHSYEEKRAATIMQQKEVTLRISLGRGKQTRTIWTCDLSYDYVKINADYRS